MFKNELHSNTKKKKVYSCPLFIMKEQKIKLCVSLQSIASCNVVAKVAYIRQAFAMKQTNFIWWHMVQLTQMLLFNGRVYTKNAD